MALTPTDYQFRLIEAAAGASSDIPSSAGQFIVEDGGKAFYDSSLGNRVELSPELSEVLGTSVVTGIGVAAGTEANQYTFTVSVINPADGSTDTKTFTQTIAVATVVADDNALPVTSGAVKAHVDSEIAAVKELAEKAQAEVYVVDGADTDTYDVAFGATYADAEPKKGDIYIFSKPITGTDPEQRTYSTYIYTGTEWAAADGSYTADNVYFTNNLTITAAIGIHTIPSSGSKTLSTAGKSVKQVFDMLVAEEKAPKATSTPAVTTKIGNGANSTPGTSAISLEAGTTVTPKYSASLSAGSYTYGPATGITATSWSVTDTLDNTSTSASGTFDSFEIAADQTYTITATATHGAGTVPVTNLGNAYDENHELYTSAVQIPGGTKSGTSKSISGYQQGYYIGTVANTTDTIDSALIRGLTKKKGGNYAAGNVSFTVPVGAARIIIACPEGKTGVTNVLNTTVNANMTESFATSVVKVAGADEDVTSDFAKNYNVWVFAPAEAYGSTADLTITLG